MNHLFRIIEILILIVAPLLFLFLRSSYKEKEIYFNVIVLPILWYILYAPIHELSHILGCFIVGTEITDYRLFAHFWEGSFGFAYVNTAEGFGENMNSFIILAIPYLLDLLSIIIGYFILTNYRIRNSFLFGFTFMVLNVRPLYDLTDNFIGYFLNHSDFVLAGKIVGNYFLFTFIIFAILTGIIVLIIMLKKFYKYPAIRI